VHPFFIGPGDVGDLLYRPGSTGMFKHADTTTLESGIVILTYRLPAA
jgi:hypothetical protein